MLNSISLYLAGLPSEHARLALRPLLEAIGDRISSQCVSSAGLSIKAAAGVLVKLGAAAVYATANGILVARAANTNMAALVGTVTINRFNVYSFFIDSAGTLTSVMGVSGATLAAVKFPDIPVGRAQLGFIVVNPTAGSFIGGTTALDAANTNVVYVNTIGPFDTTILI